MRSSFAFKLGVSVTLLTMTVAGIALAIFYSYSRAALLDEMRGRLLDLAHTGSFLFQEDERRLLVEFKRFVLARTQPRTPELLNVPADDTRESLLPEHSKQYMESVEFQHIVQILRRIQRGSTDSVTGLKYLEQDVGNGEDPPNIFWAYLMTSVPESPDHRIVMFLGDSNYQQIDYNGDGKIEGYEDGNPLGNLYAGEYEIFGKPYDTGEIAVSPSWYTDKWGTFMTAVVPIKDAQGQVIATLGLDYLVKRQSERLQQILYISCFVLAGCVLMAIVFSFFLAVIINRPITRLRRGAERISKRDFTTRIDVKSNDEFGLLADTLNGMAVEIHDYQSGLEAIVESRTRDLEKAKNEILHLYDLVKKENESLGAELDIARTLQTNLLPKRAELSRIKVLDIAFSSTPAPQVGGDYFDIITNDRGELKLGIGDVSGHGLETGLYMMMMRTAIRTLFASNDFDLVNAYSQLNDVAFTQAEQSGADIFMTLLLVSFDGKSNFTVTGQHEDIVVVRDAQTVEIIDTMYLGLPIGVIPDIRKHLHSLTVRLNPGQTLLLHTNGVTDVLNPQQERFGIERLSQVAQAHHGKPPETMHAAILEAVREFSGGAPLQDDITLVILTLEH